MSHTAAENINLIEVLKNWILDHGDHKDTINLESVLYDELNIKDLILEIKLSYEIKRLE